MTKINFKYNLKYDAYNWVRQVIFMSPGSADQIPLNIQKEILKLYKKNQISHLDLLDSMNHPIIEFVVDYIKKSQDIKSIESIRKELEVFWRKKETKFFKILSEIIQKPIYRASYNCYLSTIFNCPFYEKANWIMVSAFNNQSNQIYVVAHEFMHLQFIHWYKKYCLDKGLTKKEFWHIQEAITFLLNEPEFNNVIVFQDKGYRIHQELRKKLKRIWKKNKDFNNFLNEVITSKQNYLGKEIPWKFQKNL